MSNTPVKKQWDYYPHIWKTESAYLTWLRGQLRQIWNTSPQKKEFLKKHKKRLPKLDLKGNPLLFKNGKERLFNAFICNYCGKVCYESDRVGNSKSFAVDHIKGNHSLTTFAHVTSFMEGILLVREEDLQILCKTCHDIKSYSESQGIAYHEARFIKEAIALENSKKDKEFFIERKVPVPPNKTLRREKIVQILKKEADSS